jgi:two-component system chemotaxis sensor kinase CheA
MFEARSLEIDPVVVEFFSAILVDLKGRLHKESGGEPVEAEAVEATESPTPETVADGPKQPVVQKKQTKTIRVDEKKIDHFLESVGKLITQSEILNHLQFSFREAGINPALVRDFAAVNRAISSDIVNLQRSLMEVRQVEMDNILKKFPRLVRDISHRMNKEVELVTSGERVPIDKSLLDDVEAAMIHLVRNSIDHGLETPEEREAAGKPRRGRISIKVLQEEASILVELEDDGKGIDVEAVRRKAMEKGLVQREESDETSENDVLDLIFASGMTTKTEATDISGRGVGLDVVSSNIRKWNGEVSLDNRPGEGLTFTLRIPITNTLLTKEAILLRLGTGLFCMPLENVDEIIQLPPGQIHRHKDHYIFEHRNTVVTVIDIKVLLGMTCSTSGDPNVAHTFVLLRGKKNNRQAICAEEIVGQQKIVIKDFDLEAFRQLPY